MYPYGQEELDTRYNQNWRLISTCLRLSFDVRGFPFFGRRHSHIYICPNGLMSFDLSNYRRWPYRFGQAPWVDKYALLAPYWSLVDVYDSFNNNISHMYYHIYQEYDRHPSTINILEKAKDDVKKYTGNNLFTPTYVLVVTWVKLRHLYSTWKMVMQNKFNTFQAVLITDGTLSFAMYNYPLDGIQWSAPDENQNLDRYWFDSTLPVIGINTGEITNSYFNHPRSGTVTIVDIDQIEGLKAIKPNGDSNFRQESIQTRGRVFIHLEDSRGGNNAMMNCFNWYERDRWELGNLGLQTYLDLVQPCPCTYWQALRDRRFRLTRRQWPAVSCFLSRFRSLNGWGQKCCYKLVRRGLVLLTNRFPYAGYVQRYHELWDYQNWLPNDQNGYRYCCEDSNFCWLYQERRPSDTCIRYIPPRWTWFWGDPHFVTLDGQKYTFNGIGEFVMLDARDGYFQMQARTKLAKGSGTATVFSGVVAKERNGSKVQVTLPYDNGTMEVLVDGQPFDFERLTNESQDLSGSVAVSKPQEQCLEVTFPSGMSVTICEKQQLFSIVTACPNIFKNKTKGLLGTWNGNKDDDFNLPNGTVLSGNSSSRDIHYKFGLLWQVDSNSSLFTYKLGESFSSFANSSFSPMFIEDIRWVNDSYKQQAEAVCQGDVTCLFDAASTEDVSLGLSTLQIGTQLINDSNKMSNEPPKFSNRYSDIYLTINTTVNLVINATDPEGDDITFNVSGLPDDTNLSINPTFVLVTWKVTMQKFELQIIAIDSKGASSAFLPTAYVCPCHNNGICEKPNKLANKTYTDPGKGRFFKMSCRCVDGYSGESCETDVNACEVNSHPCYPGVLCTDIPPPANATHGFKCGPCPSGYTGNGASCTDLDECDGVNDCEQICGNTPGSYVCDCRKGYKLRVDKKKCDDVNECFPVHDCMQTCTNYQGGYNCSCEKYFKIDPSNPKQCIPETPCDSNRLGCKHVCLVADGVEQCACHQGYELDDDKKTCKDIDECAKNLYRCQQQCHNTIGGYNCSCKNGFELASDKVLCKDINECMRWTFNCTHPSQLCVNIEASYKCQCREGLYWIDNMCRGLKKNEVIPPPLPAPTPKTPTQNELQNAIIIELESFNFSKWNKDIEDNFKEAVAKAATEYCATRDCGVSDRYRYITFAGEQVHLVPGFSTQNPNRLAFYVNYPPSVTRPDKTTLNKDDLMKIVEDNKENIEKVLNTKVTEIRPYKEQLSGQKEEDLKPIIIGSAVGFLLLLLLIILILCCCRRKRSRKMSVIRIDELWDEKNIERIQRIPYEEINEMPFTRIPRATIL